MKRLTLLLATVIMLSIIACAPGGKPEESVAPITPFKVFIIKHPVADYNAWKAVFMANDSMRRAQGIFVRAVGRGIDDPNIVIAIDSIADLQKAREYETSPEVLAAMTKSGVTAPPTLAFIDVIRNDATPIPQKERVIVAHRVKDFDTWLKVFDREGKATRAAHGIVDRGMGREVGDPNMIYLVFAITDMAKAKARMESEELKKLMTEAGVEGPQNSFLYTIQD